MLGEPVKPAGTDHQARAAIRRVVSVRQQKERGLGSHFADRMHFIVPGDAHKARDGNVSHVPPGVPLNLLVGELQHRIRNLLTVVQCLVTQTESTSPEEYRAALTTRLAALADAYNLIESASEHRIYLTEMLERTLKPYAAVGKNRIYASGPDVELEPRLALSLHMAFHELATNAGKHGALASASGRVEVLWDLVSIGADRTLAVQWIERDGPAVRKPLHEGFGLRLITKVLTEAKVEMDFDRTGLVCRILIEIDQPYNE